MKAICVDPQPFRGSPGPVLPLFPSQKGSFLKRHDDAPSPRDGRAHLETSASRECGRATSLSRSCRFCSKRAVKSRLLVLSDTGSETAGGDAAALVLATQDFVANGGGRPSRRRRRSVASQGRTGSRGRVGWRGWWRREPVVNLADDEPIEDAPYRGGATAPRLRLSGSEPT